MKLVSGLVLLALAVVVNGETGGGVWTPSPDEFGEAEAIGPDGALYKGGYCPAFSVCKSTDRGRSWQELRNPADTLSSCGGGCALNVLAVGATEVFVKLFDGTWINGQYWFFYGGLTDLEYTLTVTDDATGAQRTYTKPAGSECGGADTEAFEP